MGGRGASGDVGGMWGNEGGADKSAPAKPDFPARMNRMYNGDEMSIEHTTDVFAKTHGDSGTEHLIAHDDNGFVSTYTHGGKHSVGFDPDQVKGLHVIHNHPNGSNFSKIDLVNLSTTGQKSISALNNKGYNYKAEKTKDFNPSGWKKALDSAKPKKKITSMDDYNKELHNWMTNNAHKYGVKYTRT